MKYAREMDVILVTYPDVIMQKSAWNCMYPYTIHICVWRITQPWLYLFSFAETNSSDKNAKTFYGYSHFLCVQREYFSIFHTVFYSSSLFLFPFFLSLSSFLFPQFPFSIKNIHFWSSVFKALEHPSFVLYWIFQGIFDYELWDL